MIVVEDIALYMQAEATAAHIFKHKEVFSDMVTGFEDEASLTKMLYTSELERRKLQEASDSFITYDDEIVEIEELGEMELMDITVSGSNLFYANGVLTKNSHGISMTADVMFGFISTPDLESLGHMRIKMLKNRFGQTGTSFVVAINRAKMQIRDLDTFTVPDPAPTGPKGLNKQKSNTGAIKF